MYEPASNPNIDRFLSDVQPPLDWGKAMASLNRLAMFDMLPALQLYRNRDETAFGQFGQNLRLNRPPISSERVLWAWQVVQENRVPPPIGDLDSTGQVNDARHFLAERAQSLASPPPTSHQKILNTARSSLEIDGEKFWELNEEYGQRLLNAMTAVEKQTLLPSIGGTGGFLDTKVREAFKRIGARQDGAHSWGVFSYKGKYFLTRLAHHTWTTKRVNGKVVKVTGSYVGVEAYEIPAQLGNRVASP